MSIRIFLTVLIFCLSQLAWARVGEVSHFYVDQDTSRTSSLISNAYVKQTISDFDGSDYSIEMYCDVTIRFMGRKEGTATNLFPAEVFDGDWLGRMRQGEIFTFETMEVRHAGYRDVKIDGKIFPNSDVLQFFNIDTSKSCIQAKIAELIDSISPHEDIEPMSSVEMTVAMANRGENDLAVLGFLQIDLDVERSGTRVKMGLNRRLEK